MPKSPKLPNIVILLSFFLTILASCMLLSSLHLLASCNYDPKNKSKLKVP